jgi:hypothetical protein
MPLVPHAALARLAVLTLSLAVSASARAAPAAPMAIFDEKPAAQPQANSSQKPVELHDDLKPSAGLRLAFDAMATVQYLAQHASGGGDTTENVSGAAFGIAGEAGLVDWLQANEGRGALKYLGVRVGVGAELLDGLLKNNVTAPGGLASAAASVGGALIHVPLHIGVQTFLDESVVGSSLKAIVVGVDYQMGFWLDPAGKLLVPTGTVAQLQPIALNFHAMFPDVQALFASARLKTNLAFGLPIGGSPFYLAAGVGLSWQ